MRLLPLQAADDVCGTPLDSAHGAATVPSPPLASPALRRGDVADASASLPTAAATPDASLELRAALQTVVDFNTKEVAACPLRIGANAAVSARYPPARGLLLQTLPSFVTAGLQRLDRARSTLPRRWHEARCRRSARWPATSWHSRKARAFAS